MGCGASTDSKGGEGRKLGLGDQKASGSMRTMRAMAGMAGIMDYGGNRQGHSHNQDRFVICPNLVSGVFLFGVFDGHGREGGSESADAAAALLPDSVRREVSAARAAQQDVDMGQALVKAFADHQQRCAAEYEQAVMTPMMEAKKKIEDETGVELPTLYPHEGGTTATVCVVDGPTLTTAWVGDSRAVLARVGKDGDGKPVVEAHALTVDHDVDNEAELKRIETAGGSVFGRYFAVKDADGILQLSRSLGDVGFHRGNVVTAEPEIGQRKISDDDMFLIAASDGLWTMFSNQEAVDFVNAGLVERNYREEPRSSKVMAVLTELEAAAHGRATARRKKKDDVGIVLVTFSPYWLPDHGVDIATVKPSVESDPAIAEEAAEAASEEGRGGAGAEPAAEEASAGAEPAAAPAADAQADA